MNHKPGFITSLKKLFKQRSERPLTEEALQEIIHTSGEAGLITDDTHEMLSSIIELKDIMVQEVMVPRTDFIALKADDSLNECIKIINDNGFSRYPVYQENLDNIVGILYAKDILKFLHDDLDKIKAQQIKRAVYFIPETKKVQELLQELRKKGIHIAVAVDEYGGISGMVTFSDLVEEIIGDIYEEENGKKKPEEKNIVPQPDGSFVVNGKTKIEEFEELLQIEVDNRGKFESVGGLAIYLFGKIPRTGEQTTYKNMTISIAAADERRVKKIVVTPMPESMTSMEKKTTI